jgi:hypothetical protein
MPLYEITTKGEEKKRLIEATSANQAVRHCSTGLFQTRTITKPSEIAQLMKSGVQLEAAGDEAEPQAD